MKNYIVLFLVVCLSIPSIGVAQENEVSTAEVKSQVDSVKISGKIYGGLKTPLQNVQVEIEGVFDVAPSITNEEGEFTITSPSGYVWLIINPAYGYQRKRVFLNNRNNFTVYLTPEDMPSVYNKVRTQQGMEEKRNIVGSYTEVKTGDFIAKPYEVTDQYFQGTVPGMMVTNHSGMSGEGAFEIIRGIKSMRGNVQPLYIIDGVIMEEAGSVNSPVSGHNFNPLVSIDPQDISNITVLKDASATALYGMKGSNGVVLIETLKPTELQTTIDVKVRGGISFSPNEIPVLNSGQHKSLAQEVLVSSGLDEELYKDRYPGLFDDRYEDTYYKYNNETNWQDKVFRNTTVQDIALTIKGGDAIARYGLSVGYLNHKGIIENTDFSRFNIRFVGTFTIVEWLRMYISSAVNYNSSSLMDNGLNIQTSPIYSALFKAPSMNPYQINDNGKELTFLDEVGEFGISNPTAVVDGYNGFSDNYRMMSSVRLDADLLKNLKFETLLSVNMNKLRDQIYWPNQGMSEYNDGEAINVIMAQTDALFSIYNDNKVTYHNTFGQHALAATGGLRINTNHFEEDRGIAVNAPENDEYRSLGNGQTKLATIEGENANWNWLSFYGNVGYSFRDKYLINGVVSLDGSSRIGQQAETGVKLFDSPFGVFSSISGAWRLSSEPYIRDMDGLEELKLRASYGKTGNDDIGAFNSRTYYSPVRYDNTTGVVLGSIPNEKLKHEEVYKTNFGVDISLLGERLNIVADYFDYKTEDMLIFERQSVATGYPFNPTNGGAMRNTGFEVGFNARVIDAGKFKFDLGANISSFKNEITQITGGSLVTEISGAEIISRIGDPVNSFYGYIADGVFESTQAAQSANLKNNRGKVYGAGDVKFRDISGEDGAPDGIINDFDKTIIGDPNPDYYGGVMARLGYGPWALNANFTYSVGNDVYNFVRYQTEKMTDLSNQSAAVLRRWQHEGQVTDIPKASYGDPMGNSAFSSRFIEDGSYVRLRSLSLSYTISNEFKLFGLDRATLRNAQVFVTGTNLFTISKYLGYDPEFSYSTDPLLQGIDYGQTPQNRSFLVGVKFGL